MTNIWDNFKKENLDRYGDVFEWTWKNIRKYFWHFVFLKKLGLWNDYKNTMQKYGFSNIASMANYYYFQIFKKHCNPKNVLEIGAGGGIFALFCLEHFPIETYTIVDLPEMLEVSKRMIVKYAPNDFDKFRFLTEVPDKSFDTCININSFAEMNEVIRLQYFSKLTGKVFAVNYERDGYSPLTYPSWGKTLHWKVDKLRLFVKGSKRMGYIKIYEIS